MDTSSVKAGTAIWLLEKYKVVTNRVPWQEVSEQMQPSREACMSSIFSTPVS